MILKKRGEKGSTNYTEQIRIFVLKSALLYGIFFFLHFKMVTLFSNPKVHKYFVKHHEIIAIYICLKALNYINIAICFFLKYYLFLYFITISINITRFCSVLWKNKSFNNTNLSESIVTRKRYHFQNNSNVPYVHIATYYLDINTCSEILNNNYGQT